MTDDSPWLLSSGHVFIYTPLWPFSQANIVKHDILVITLPSQSYYHIRDQYYNLGSILNSNYIEGGQTSTAHPLNTKFVVNFQSYV